PLASSASTGYSEDPGLTSSGNRRGHQGNELLRQAHAAGWATPVATELGNTLENYTAMKRNMTSGPRTAITHPSLQAKLGVSGEDAPGSGAETASIGQLNPAPSLWLMGLPDAWLFAAPPDKTKKRSTRLPSASTGTTGPEPSPGAATPSSGKSR